LIEFGLFFLPPFIFSFSSTHPAIPGGQSGSGFKKAGLVQWNQPAAAKPEATQAKAARFKISIWTA